MARCRAVLFGLGLAGCADLPEISYERAGFSLAVEFDQPVCEGTLRAMERRIEHVEATADVHNDVPMTIYWLTSDLQRVCPRPTSGCFIPGTRIVAAEQPSIHHEIVHAVLNTRGSNPFAEEGLAELLSGAPARYDSNLGDRPLRSLSLSPKDARQGDVDYVRAAHFMHFVRREAGDAAVADLASAIDRGLSPGRFVDTLEQHFGVPGSEIERAYAFSDVFFPSQLSEETDPVTPFELTSGMDVSLDCDSPRTFGPIVDDEPGMVQLRRLADGPILHGNLMFFADDDVDAVLFRETDPFDDWVQDWWMPRPGLDEARIVLQPGQTARVHLDPQEGWLIMVRRRGSTASARAKLFFTPTE